jgi:Tfp pilus assembly protein PilP
VGARRRNRITLLLLIGIAAIPFLLGMPPAQAKEKVTIKIPKRKKKITKPSKEPIKEKTKVDTIETKDEKGKEAAAYSYDPTNKVDPFKSFIVVRKELEEKEREPRTYLETLEISQLTLSAIVLTNTGNWALVRDSKGDGHTIKVGTPIGRKRGKVIKILDREVVVRESYEDMRGRKKIRDISMTLPEVD